MVTQEIPWVAGGRDKITISYSESSANQTLTITSDANTTGSSRSKTISVSTTGSGGKTITRYIIITQSSGISSEIETEI